MSRRDAKRGLAPLCGVIAALAAAPAAPALAQQMARDKVTLQLPGASSRTIIACTVLDYTGESITIRTRPNQPPRDYPTDHVVEVRTPQTEPHMQGLEAFAAGRGLRVLEVNGVPGWLFQYTTRDADDPLFGDTLCLLHEDWLVAVAFATREWLYAATRPVFETAIRSLRLRTPDGMRPLARGFRRFEDPRGAYRLLFNALFLSTAR